VQNATVADLASMIEDSLSRSGKGGMAAAMQFVKSIAATPSITFVGDTDTGINSDTGGKVDLVGNGTVALSATSAGIAIPGTLGVTGAATLASTLAVTGVITATAGIDCNAQKIVDVLDPTTDQEAATKKYVDDAITAYVVSATWTQPTAGVDCVTNALRVRKLASGTVEFNGRISFTGAVADNVDILVTGPPPWNVASGGYTSFNIMVPMYNSVGPSYAEIPVTFTVNGGQLRMFISVAPYAGSATATIDMTGITYYSA